MELEFTIGDIPAKLTRGWFWGNMQITTPDQLVRLQHPLHPSTHFSFRLKRSWTRTISGHEILVEHTRPLLFAGLRGQGYKVFVDGKLEACGDGY